MARYGKYYDDFFHRYKDLLLIYGALFLPPMVSNPEAISPGLWKFDSGKYDSQIFQYRFAQFLQRPFQERLRFTQKAFDNTYDGYSYPRQKDSYNQGDLDELHSFVVTPIAKKRVLPEEMNFLKLPFWQTLHATVQDIEQNLINLLEVDVTGSLLPMLSCNYYPAKNKKWPGLEAHPDISLFTHFPFGSDGYTEYQLADGSWLKFPKTNQWLVFTGYFIEWLSRGRIKALNHRVGTLPAHLPRYTFAWFTIPSPQSRWEIGEKELTGTAYHQAYLDLF